eukprot:Skav228817  [mRNA]  locus=scaffold359:353973:361872:+ [translate_table: standard]
MTGSVVQAVVLAALSSSDAFLHLRGFGPASPLPLPGLGDMMVQSQQDDDHHEQEPGSSDHIPADEGEDANQEPQPRSSQKRKRAPKPQSPPNMAPLRRVRGKQSVLLAVPPPKRKRGQGGGNKKACGKSKMVSIFDKEKICKAYDELVANGEACPDKELKKWKMHGYYRGCCLKSKWGQARIEQQWPLLVETAPRLCKAKKELPNSLRQVINFPRLKPGNFSTSTSRTFLPPALKHVLEEMIMEKIDRGEEVNINYVKNTTLWLAKLWNDCIASVRERITEQNLDQLRDADSRLAAMTDKQLDEVFSNMTKRADEVLVPIALCSADDSVRSIAADVDMDDDAAPIAHAEQLDMEKACHDAGVNSADIDGSESEGDFVLADSDDDIKDFAIVDAKVEKVKNFLFRPVFQKLHKLGLTSLPRHVSGCSISYHSKERRWQGIYPGKTKGMSSSWGGNTNRAEEEALIKVIRSVLTAYREAWPKDKLWKKQLELVVKAEANHTHK